MRDQNILVLAVAFAAISLVVGASLSAGKVVERAGEHSSYGAVSRIPDFYLYYGCLASALVAAAYLFFRGHIPSPATHGLAALGSLPEVLYGLMNLQELPSWLFRTVNTGLFLLNSPGFLLHWFLTGIRWDRWAEGLLSPPTRLTLLSVATIGCLNILGWLPILCGARRVLRRREEGS